MLLMSQHEANVFERIKLKQPVDDIAIELNVKKDSVIDALTRLKRKKAIISRTRGKYDILITEYEINHQLKRAKKADVTKVFAIQIPTEYERIIRKNYNKMPRRELARLLKLDKVTLNIMIMQLGL